MNQITISQEYPVLKNTVPSVIIPMAYMIAAGLKRYTDEIRAVRKKEACTVPLWHKYLLTIEEAAEYFGIGEKRLRRLANENVGAEYIMEVGSQLRFKRELFEAYLNDVCTL